MERRLFDPPAELTGPELARAAGMDYELSKKLWRALGMPAVPDEARAFDGNDVETVRALQAFIDAGIPAEDVIAVTRVVGRSLARIADAEAHVFRKVMVDPLLATGASREELVERLRPLGEQLVELNAVPLMNGFRRLLFAAQQDFIASAVPGRQEILAAAFVDLVDFSRVSDHLEADELMDLVSRFEELAIHASAESGVRVVKTVGDAVMLVSADPRLVLGASRAIIRGAEQESILPAARAGIDFGNVVPAGGDYFGRPVNVAARCTAFAWPGTVVVTRQFLDALPPDSVRTSFIGPQRLKGVGRVDLFKVKEPRSST